MTLPAHLIEPLAAAAYEATRTPSFPAWAETTPGYRSDMVKAISAALQAGVNAEVISLKEGGGA